MIIIQTLLAAGFFVSVIVHAASLVDLFEFPRLMATALHFGSFAGMIAAVRVSRQTREKVNVADFKRIVRKACPHGLLVFTGILILYAFTGLLHAVVNKYSQTAPAPETAAPRYVTAHWPALYALAFMIVDSCRRYLRNNDEMHS